MEFICSVQELKAAVVKTCKVINKNTTLDILEKLLLQTDDAKLILRGTDLGSTIETVIEANVIEQGASTIEAKTFIEILDKVNTEDVKIQFDIESEKILITSGSAKFTIYNPKGNDKYPDVDQVKQDTFFTIEREEFVKGISYTLFSVSKDTENKQFLTGINIDIDSSNKVSFISTDSQRLSRYETIALEKVSSADKPFTFIIPSVSAKILQELAKVPGDPITLYWSDNTIKCAIDNSVYYARLIEVKYPDVSRVIPKDFNSEITIAKNAFLNVLGRMDIASKDNGDRSTINLQDGNLNFSAETKEHNILINEDVNCQSVGVNIDRMCLHVKHVIDALNVINSEEVEVKIVGPEKAFLIKMKDNNKFIHVLMPIRLN